MLCVWPGLDLVSTGSINRQGPDRLALQGTPLLSVPDEETRPRDPGRTLILGQGGISSKDTHFITCVQAKAHCRPADSELPNKKS